LARFSLIQLTAIFIRAFFQNKDFFSKSIFRKNFPDLTVSAEPSFRKAAQRHLAMIFDG
jgi:hypothetical protein